VIEHQFPAPRSRKRGLSLGNAASTAKKVHFGSGAEEMDELEDSAPQALSVIRDILDKPGNSVKMMTQFKKSMTQAQAENVVSWLLSIGDVDNGALDGVKKGGLKFPQMEGELFFPIYCVIFTKYTYDRGNRWLACLWFH
jgi:hypothetical protein